MALLDHKVFGGMRPKIAPQLLDATEAQLANNCNLSRGDLRSFKQPSREEALDPTSLKSLYQFTENGNDHWIVHADELDFVESPIINDQYERVFFTGEDEPRFLANDIVSSPFDLDTDYLKLGIPAPTTAPTIGSTGGGATYHAYIYRFVNSYGDMGANSPIDSISNYDSGRRTVEDIEDGPTGCGIDRIWLYRVNTGETLADFQLVCEAFYFTETRDYEVGEFTIYSNDLYECTAPHTAGAWNAGHFTAGELVPDSSLTTLFEGDTWVPPPEDLTCLIAISNGSLAGVSVLQKAVCFSEPFKPWAWPVSYRKPLNATPIALGQFGTNVVVATNGRPTRFYGQHPAAMGRVDIGDNFPCVTKRSLSVWQNGVYYRGPDGFIRVDENGAINITDKANIIDRDAWKSSYAPTLGCFYNDLYFGFNASRGIILDLKNMSMRILNLIGHATFISRNAGEFFFIANDTSAIDEEDPPETMPLAIYNWEGDDTNYMYYTWRGRLNEFNYESNPAYLLVSLDRTFYEAVIAQIDLATLNVAIFAGDIAGALRNTAVRLSTLRGDDLYTIGGFDISADVVVKLYDNGTLISATTVTGASSIVSLPASVATRKLEIEISGYVPLQRVAVAASIEELGVIIG